MSTTPTTPTPSWATLPVEQSLALRSAATRLAVEFDGIYGLGDHRAIPAHVVRPVRDQRHRRAVPSADG